MKIPESQLISSYLNNQATNGSFMPIFLNKKTPPEPAFSPLKNLTAVDYTDSYTQMKNLATSQSAYPVRELSLQANLKNVLSSMDKFIQNKARKEGILLVGPDNTNNYAAIQKSLFSKFSENLDQAFSIIDTFKTQISAFKETGDQSILKYIESLKNLLSAETISKKDIASFLEAVDSSIKQGRPEFTSTLGKLAEQLTLQNNPALTTIETTTAAARPQQIQVKTLYTTSISNAISFLEGSKSILGQTRDILMQMLDIVQSTNADALTSTEQLSIQQDLNQLRIDLSGTLNTLSETLYQTTSNPLTVNGLEITISGAGTQGAKTSVSTLELAGTTGTAPTNPISLTGTNTVSNLTNAIAQINSETTQIDSLIAQLNAME